MMPKEQKHQYQLDRYHKQNHVLSLHQSLQSLIKEHSISGDCTEIMANPYDEIVQDKDDLGAFKNLLDPGDLEKKKNPDDLKALA